MQGCENQSRLQTSNREGPSPEESRRKNRSPRVPVIVRRPRVGKAEHSTSTHCPASPAKIFLLFSFEGMRTTSSRRARRIAANVANLPIGTDPTSSNVRCLVADGGKAD